MLPISLLASACRIFLDLAYADGPVPDGKRAYLELGPADSLDPLLQPPVCETLKHQDDGRCRGYAFRLGSSHFPHVKLQTIWHEETRLWLVGVDTHDTITVPAQHPDFPKIREIREKNRHLKERIELAWEQAGLVTFKSILRQKLDP